MPPPYKASAPPADLLRRPPVVSVLAIFNYVCAVLYALVALGIVIGLLQDHKILLAMLLGSLFMFLSVVHYFCGRGLWKLRKYGRTIQLVFAWIWVIAFPLGTVISILILIYLFKAEIKILFADKAADQAMNAGAIAALFIAGFFVVIFISGIVAAIAIPNLLNAIQRAKQKRTMADIRLISSAVEAYAKEHNAYPPTTSLTELRQYLEPAYLQQMPEVDGWTHPFRYMAWTHGSDASLPVEYMILSAGKDGAFEHEDFEAYQKTQTTDFNNDIVFSNGEFLQYPESSYSASSP